MRYKTKEGRPLCRYCLKLLSPYHHDTDWGGGYGRHGDSLFCTATCAEYWATRRITGRSVPKGKSHEAVGRAWTKMPRTTTTTPRATTTDDLAKAIESARQQVKAPSRLHNAFERDGDDDWCIDTETPDPTDLP